MMYLLEYQKVEAYEPDDSITVKLL